jgi:hypothetical protein
MEPGIRWPAKVPMLSDRNVAQPHVLAPRKQQNDFFSQVVRTVSDREKKKKKQTSRRPHRSSYRCENEERIVTRMKRYKKKNGCIFKAVRIE